MTTGSAFHIGEQIDPAGARTGTPVEIDPADLTTHGVILGMTGSGKTGLGIVLLEEALSRGIPALILDPKGDMGNLLLNFPALRPEDFRPWIDEAAAARAGQTPDELAASTAERWKGGLAEWGVGPDRMRRLGTAAAFTIFTPGSTAGVPLDVVGSLAPPDSGTPPEARADQVEGFVSGLLSLIGRDADPLSSPDHILLSNLITHAWDAGQSLTLPALVERVATPPIRRLGVFELDTFIPPKERMALAVQLNALLASPSFQPWMRGVPLDPARLLWDGSGRPRAAILQLAHLSEPERQFIVTLTLSRLVGWMRAQSGTSELRALVYMDEVAGFAPPTANPPSKKPILTILKQARAHGIGMVLSTQNPVDLDYKAIANAGTWVIGRLQTERDKERVLEGMRSAAGGVDLDALGRSIGGLGKRQFLLHTSRGGAPRAFTSRWSMSYLRGPITRLETERLMKDDGERAAALRGSSSTAASSSGATAASSGAGSGAPAALSQDEVSTPPKVAAGIAVRWLDPAAPWAAAIGARAGSTRLEAAVAARVHLRFDDAAAGVDQQQEYECVFHPLADPPRAEDARPVDYDERDLAATAPAGAVYALPAAPIDKPAFFKGLERRLEEHLQRSRSVVVLVNRALGLFSRPAESKDAFLERCRDAAATSADAEAAKLRDKYGARLDRMRQRQDAAEDRARELSVDTQQRVQQELIAGAGQLLSVFLGGRARLGSLTGAASRRSTTRRTRERLDTAKGKAADVGAEIQECEEDLADDLGEIQRKWESTAGQVESKAIPLDQGDVRLDEIVLVWVPA
jgi:hypothetical protein